MTAPQEDHPRAITGPLTLAAVVCLLLVVLMGCAFLFLPRSQALSDFSDVMSAAIDVLTAGAVFVAARASLRRSRRLGLAWGAFALASLLHALGDAVWAVLEIGLHAVPFPSIADAFYLSYYGVFLVGVYLLITRPKSKAERVNDALDLAAIFITAILAFGIFLIGPVLKSNTGASPFELSILAAYPVGDLVLLAAVLFILYNHPPPAGLGGKQLQPGSPEQPAIPVILLAAGMLLMIVSDCLYTAQTLVGAYASGGLLDVGWMASSLVIGLAAIAQVLHLQAPSSAHQYRPGPVFQAGARWVKGYLPYLWLIVAFGILVVAGFKPLPMSFLSIAVCVSGVLGLVLVRQFVTLSENQRLSLRLAEQATRLEFTNRDLKQEIAERVRVQEELAFDVLHDQMTGLANRRLFLDRLGQAIKRSRRHHEMSFAVLFMDLDQFKVVNDTHGHSFGDQLLIAAAHRLEQTVRYGDTVARFGGDEFAILLDDLNDQADAQQIAEKVRDAIAVPFLLKDREIHITASIGVVTDLTKYEHADELLRDVDLAMYRAKALGRARCMTFTPELRNEAFSRIAIEEALRNAIGNNELQLLYQPISSLESDQIVAVEALLRWHHPTRGLLLPAQFLPVAEQSDIILLLGDWVLREACRQLRAWRDQSPHLADMAVHVNISNREFSQPDLAEKIRAALENSGLQGSALRLEITERILLDNYPTSNDAILALNQLGVKVAIDNFGTGYSALAYLQQFPVTAIKIDKSFISDMRHSRKGLGLVRALVSMARELGMETVAEGIETGEQLSELRGLLCGYGQGFLLFEPMDADHTGLLLSKQR